MLDKGYIKWCNPFYFTDNMAILIEKGNNGVHFTFGSEGRTFTISKNQYTLATRNVGKKAGAGSLVPTVDTYIQIIKPNGDVQFEFLYDDLVDKLGTSTGVEYIKKLSNDGYFHTGSSIVTLDTNNATGDAFGRARTSDLFTIFDSKKLYGLSEGTYWSAYLNGGATRTHIPADSCVRLEVFNDGDYVIRQTRQRFNYQPGKSMLYLITGVMAPVSNTISRIGCFHGGFIAPFDVIDGLLFEHDGSAMYVRNYKGGVATQSADQSSWSMDKLDGTGPSNVIADWSKGQIFVIDYEWLGLGRVRFGVNIDGLTIYVHSFNNANRVTSVYMRSPNQPVRYELRSTGGATYFDEVCCSVQSEGGFNPAGLIAANPLDMTPVNIGTSWELVTAVRLKTSEIDASVEVLGVEIYTPTNVNYKWALLWNPIIAGATTWTPLTGASVEQLIGNGTNLVTPIITMSAGFADRQASQAVASDFETTLKLGATVDGVCDVIALCAKVETSTADFQGLLKLKQLT